MRWIVLAVLVALLAPVGYVVYSLASTLCAVSTCSGSGNAGLPDAGGVSIGGTVYVLVMGSDERHDANGKIVSGDVPHSDTMILLALDTDHHAARMLSVPRDLLVSIPGYGPGHRINEAYTLGTVDHLPGGGAALAVRTMEQLTGINVPFYAVTTFDGFRQVVDAVGGVQIDADRPITDHQYPGQGNDYMPIYIPAGLQLMDGARALEFVRSRHDDPLSDFGRNQRQQKLMRALSQKLLQPERLGQFNQFLDIARTNVSTNLSPAQILGLARTLAGAGRQIKTYAVGPSYVTSPSASQQLLLGAVLIPDKARIAALVSAFQNGDPPPDASPTP
jgi:LCP family protein required for cell wall assembly